jgi:hypothetical protein
MSAALGANALCAGNDSTFVGQTVPATLFVGQVVDVTVTMQNTGDTTWTNMGGYRLGPQDPEDNFYWGTFRVLLPNDVPPCTTDATRCTVTFEFPISRSVLGTTPFQWRVLQSNVEWFGAFTPVINIQVLPAPTPTLMTTPTPTPRSTQTPVMTATQTTPPHLPEVSLLKAGSDNSPDAWCDPQNQKALRGSTFPITFIGRSRTGTDTQGTLRFVGNAPAATWASGADPMATFHPTPGPIGEFTVRMKLDAGFGVRTLSFAGVDTSGAFGPIVGCKVQVTDTLLDVGIDLLTLDVTTTPWTARMRIHNLSTIPLSVPWSLSIGGQLASGTPVQHELTSSVLVLNPGATADVFASLPPGPQRQSSTLLTGSVDPLNTIGENESARDNNTKVIALAPSSGSTGTTTLVLDADLARTAGATFTDNPTSGSHCSQLGVGNWKDSHWAPNRWFPSGGRDTGALFVADCPGPTGGSADPEVYGNFDLKNGWRVVSADTPLVRA